MPTTVTQPPVLTGSARPATLIERFKPRDRFWWLAMITVLVIGVAGQIRVWASDRGFWNDELYVAINIRDEGFVRLAGPLRYVQVAPPGWLAGERVLYRLFGGGELVLRLPQLLAGITLLLLTAMIGMRILGRWGALLATALIATSPLVYYYAGELKQYSVEAAAALAVLAIYGWLADRPAMTWRPPPRPRADRPKEAPSSLGILEAELPRSLGPDGTGDPLGGAKVGLRRAGIAAGILLAANVFSYSALIVTGGVAAGLALAALLDRRRRFALMVLLISTPAIAYGAFQILRRMRFPFLANQYAFFPTGMPPEGAGPGELITWLPRMWQGLIANPLTWQLPWLILILAVAGIYYLFANGRRHWALMFLGLFGAAIAAAAAHGLPMEDRVALYLVAPLALLTAAGIHGLAAQARALLRDPRRPLAPGALVAALTVVAVAGLGFAVKPAVAASVNEVRQPLYRDVTREVIRDVASRIQPGDVVLVYDFSQPLASWYGSEYRLPIVGLAGLGSDCDESALDTALTGARRVFYVRGARLSSHPEDYHAHVLAALQERATLTESKIFGSGGVLDSAPAWALLDLTAGADSRPASTRPPADQRFQCLTVTSEWR